MGHDVFDDAREVSVAVSSPTPVPITAPAGGRLTAFDCQPGSTFASGSAPLSIDGVPRLALATSVPLWRDLNAGSRGADVLALQDELTRLGYPVARDGEVGANTLAAARSAFESVGMDLEPTAVIPASSVLWLPAPSSTVASCDLAVGVLTSAGAILGAFTSIAPTASVVSMPTDLVDGDRVVEAAGARVLVDPSGTIRDPGGLAALAAAGSGPSADSGGADTAAGGAQGLGRISGRLILAEPVAVSIVPPGAVDGLSGSHGCVHSGTRSYPVRILGSRLGQTMVTFEGPAPKRVALGHRTETPCT